MNKFNKDQLMNQISQRNSQMNEDETENHLNSFLKTLDFKPDTRANNPERLDEIDQICQKLNEIWRHCPTLRLGQLISNACKGPSIFYEEDSSMMNLLNEFEHHMNSEKAEQENQDGS